MKFTVVSHAGLLVETKDESLLCDPWVIGSCYWRSWWNYPPPPASLIQKLKPGTIYLTHVHWDHFHGPSLRRFAPDTLMLVPKAHFTRMVDDLAGMGFTRIQELPHGVSTEISNGFNVTSYQFGPALDSILVIESEGRTFVNANDCKMMGRPLRHLASRHPNVDFVFRSHSSAGPYPWCVTSNFPEQHLRHRSNEDYAAEFLAFAERLGAKYAIPFASNHCFLHKETRKFNSTSVSPVMIKEYFDQHRTTSSECRVMIPGDIWSDAEGFVTQTHDYFTARDRHIELLAEKHKSTLEMFYAQEDRVAPHWPSFQKYFSALLSALPPLFSRFFPALVIFNPTSPAGRARWLVDFRKRVVSDRPDPTLVPDVEVTLHANVLRDCCRKRMFSVFTASKRGQFHLHTPSALRLYFMFLVLMDAYESGYFPVRLWFRRRFLANWIRRWREILFNAGMLFSLAFGRGNRLRPVDHIRE
ncbi:MAG TPA: hypothetical protein VI895_05915 [Bdellovibrionota bacterium]|nr:hypothetical protein [Bdellovibrionota bacterium]